MRNKFVTSILSVVVTMMLLSGNTLAGDSGDNTEVGTSRSSSANYIPKFTSSPPSLEDSVMRQISSLIYIGSSSSGATSGIEIGSNSSGNRTSYIDIIGDDTYSDYGFRLIRFDDGANSVSSILHRGTGNFNIQTTDASALKFRTNNTTRITIDENGEIGIGTTAPDVLLDVLENEAYSVAAKFNNDGDNETRYGIAIAAGEDNPDNVGQETEWVILHDGNGTQRGGIALFYGDPDIYTTSDPRLKADIAPTKISGLAVIESLDLIEYRRKNNLGVPSKYLEPIGFNAENVANEFPPAAGHLPESDIKTVAPGKLIPVLAKAIQELDAEVQDARAENARLVNELWELKILVCRDHPTASVCK